MFAGFLYLKSLWPRLIRPLIRPLILGLAVLCLLVVAARAEVTVKSVKISEQAEAIEITIKTTGSTRFSATTQTSPNRLSIDFEGATFDLPLGAGRKRQGKIMSFRYGVDTAKKATLVFDSEAPLLITESGFGKKEKGGARTFKITLHATTDQTFAKLAKPAETPKEVKKIVEVKAVAQQDAPVASTPAIATHAPGAKRVIVIDPGHGGIDPGAVSKSGVLEKTVVFAYAEALKVELDKIGRYEVVLTRTTDKFISLPNRLKFAREKKADLFIALHADTLRGKTATGMTFYTLSNKGSDEEAEALAQKENKVDVIAGLPFVRDNPDVADILVELAQHESMNHAVFLSRMAVERLKPITRLSGKPIRSAGFTVLRAPETPSILIELGFLSSQDDLGKLQSQAWRQKTAGAMAESIDAYFSENVPVNSISSPAMP
jgi:N-acetylmuramoyl-L-alanine amidase